MKAYIKIALLASALTTLSACGTLFPDALSKYPEARQSTKELSGLEAIGLKQNDNATYAVPPYATAPAGSLKPNLYPPGLK